ncbi:MAG: magnesium transporter [Clostridiales bacterium GWE2_32_10]|nr:MAG: magnesium transporter [Clostridiales bacterium GWE2_32_10]HBY19508.1 magnesium transporter [Clostridiales bacterium]
MYINNVYNTKDGGACVYNRFIELIEEKKYQELKKMLMDMNEADVAEALEKIDDEAIRIKIFRLLPKDLSAEVFSYFHTNTQKNIIETFSEKELTKLIEESYFDDVIDLIEEMPASVTAKIIKSVDKEKRKLINQFLNYPEDSAGSLMTIEYIDLKEDMFIKEAIEYIKELDLNDENINICYVTDAKRILKGVVPLHKLLLLSDRVKIGNIMEEEDISINTNETGENCANIFKKYDIVTAPVVDNENRLVGIITIDDIIDVIEQENTEDIQMLAGITPSDKGYLESSVVNLAKNRIVWLLVLMISATLSGMIIREYESVLQSVVILVAFLPMLMGTGGNSGSQASTLVIRGLALEDIKTVDVIKVIWKELRVGLLVGGVLAAANFARILFFEKVQMKVATVVCLTLFFTVVIAKILGGILPIIAKKLKLDPAIMAAPLISTMSDVMVLMIYLNIAKLLLGI